MRSYSALLVAVSAVLFSASMAAADSGHRMAHVRSDHLVARDVTGGLSREQIRRAYGKKPHQLKPKFNPNMDCSCQYNADGWLTEVSENGCPAKVNPHPHNHPDQPNHPNKHHHHHRPPPPHGPQCNIEGGRAVIDANVLNCSSLCVLSVGCPDVMESCQVGATDGSVIGVTALDCTAINLLSVTDNLL